VKSDLPPPQTRWQETNRRFHNYNQENFSGSLGRNLFLFYNAVTRAKRQAMVVVQDPDCLNKPLFAMDA